MPLISKSLWAAAAVFAAGFTPVSSQALTEIQGATPPGYNASCNCYRAVPYGSATWLEPTTRKMARQVMDIWMPTGFGGPRPIVYYGHPNGTSNFIAYDKTAGSLYSRFVKPLTDQGYIVVSYEFRHPVVNYVAGSPAPRYDIQKAINYFTSQYTVGLNADPTNSFITGQSRGGGLGLLTALTGKFTNGTTVRALWTYQAQTTFNCNEMANDFVLENERSQFLSQCTAVPGAGSSLQSVSVSAPPVHAAYDRPFRMELVHASDVDVHYPDFGYQLCRRYQAEATESACQATPSVAGDTAWVGMADYFNAHRQ
ncbi:MAG TPA: hypothetical protein VFY73_06590 [Ideonella sp.]|uniref:hypothetical protein n=1 Tax=Ideonella sp. TaxID=1929293 RepID=UPI002E357BC7|nr:hypothetical protein [Ideonella sp.]HEX5683689.1 hypothetical protein [Ideonella sp.]